MPVRALLGILWWAFVIAGAEAWKTTAERRALSVNDIPTCGLTCLFLTVPASGCAFSDIECQCRNAELAKSSSACLLANCTMAETLDTAKVQAQLCGLPNTSKSDQVRNYSIVALSVATLFVALRLYGKISRNRFGLDDWIITFALCLTVLPAVCTIKMANTGFGQHFWNLQHGQLLDCLRLFYIGGSTYTICLGLIKVSLCMFYLEVFTFRRAQIACLITLAYIVINTIIIFFLTVFSCRPIPYYWNRDVRGKCLNTSALAYANSGSAIAQDVILLIIPLACIQKLNMKRYRKVAVGVMFAIGTFGCITTMIRLQALMSFKATIDPTWDYVSVTNWTTLELAAGFICVSLPAVRISLSQVVTGSFFSSIVSRSRSHGEHSNSVESVQKPPRKHVSWMHISTNNYNDTESSSRSSRLWPGTSSPYMPGSRSHRRLGSLHGDEGIDMTPVRTSTHRPCPAHESEEIDRVLELRPVPGSRHNNVCYSCSFDESISALPRIGCLPDKSFSKEDGNCMTKSEIRWWEEVRKKIERSGGVR